MFIYLQKQCCTSDKGPYASTEQLCRLMYAYKYVWVCQWLSQPVQYVYISTQEALSIWQRALYIHRTALYIYIYAYKCVCVCQWMSHVVHLDMSVSVYVCISRHVYMSVYLDMSVSVHVNEWVMSCQWMSHVVVMFKSTDDWYAYVSAVSFLWVTWRQ